MVTCTGHIGIHEGADTLGYRSCATFLFLPHFDVICDLLLNRRTATWNLFVNHIFLTMVLRARAPSARAELRYNRNISSHISYM